MNKFRHPSVTSGQLTHGDQSFTIVDGVLECPDSIARELGLAPVGSAVEDSAAHDPLPSRQPDVPTRGKAHGKGAKK